MAKRRRSTAATSRLSFSSRLRSVHQPVVVAVGAAPLACATSGRVGSTRGCEDNNARSRATGADRWSNDEVVNTRHLRRIATGLRGAAALRRSADRREVLATTADCTVMAEGARSVGVQQLDAW